LPETTGMGLFPAIFLPYFTGGEYIQGKKLSTENPNERQKNREISKIHMKYGSES